MDDLVQELIDLHITKNEAARAYQREVDDISRRERVILVDIQRRQHQDDKFTNNIRNNRQNPIVTGDIVRITNEYNPDEFGIVGCVTQVTRHMVELHCVKTQKLSKRAWWNVERVRDSTDTK